MADASSPPIEIKLHKRSRELEIEFADGVRGRLSAEYLRVHSPSAEVKGHGGGEGVLVAGKKDVGIERIEPVGHYAVRLVFDDGHNTGLYTWPILYDLCRHHDANWRRYLERLERAGKSRERPAGGPARPRAAQEDE
ncbi:MAG TPA: DUF971 domain-containing protein [Gammaproteobacteria bacterium]